MYNLPASMAFEDVANLRLVLRVVYYLIALNCTLQKHKAVLFSPFSRG